MRSYGLSVHWDILDHHINLLLARKSQCTGANSNQFSTSLDCREGIN
jgi:hypothetical protein